MAEVKKSLIQQLLDLRAELEQVDFEFKRYSNEAVVKRKDWREEMGKQRRYELSAREKKEAAEEMLKVTAEENRLRDRFYDKKQEITQFIQNNRDELAKEYVTFCKKEVQEYKKAFADAYNKGIKLRRKLDELKRLTPELFMPMPVLQVHIPFKETNGQGQIGDLDKVNASTEFYR